MPGEIKATPQQPALGTLARLLKGREELQQRVPSMTGTILDLLLPTSETVEKWSYGETPIRINPYAGRTASYIPEIRDPAYALETASFLPLVSPAARATSKAANTLGDVAVRAITRNPAATSTGVLREAAAMSPLSSVVKPKGGAGWLAGELSPKRTVSQFRETGPYDRRASEFLDTLQETNPAAYQEYRDFAKNLDFHSLGKNSSLEWELAAINKWRESRGEPPITIDKPDEAVNKWIETKLNKYVTNEMATPEDPVRKLAEENILHYQPLRVFPNSRVAEEVTASRELTGYPVEGLGQSELAKRWETFADYGITPMTAKDRLHDLASRGTSNANRAIYENQWLKDSPPESMTYSPNAMQFIQSADQFGFPHMVDELRNAVDPASTLPPHLRLTPKQLENLEMPNAVKLVDKINKYRAAEAIKAEKAGMMANLQAEPRLTNPDFKLSFVDKPGSTWINVPETIDEKGVRLCTTIGKQGGWCTMDEPRAKSYGSGGNRLVVMLDADGRPHLQATITHIEDTGEIMDDIDNIMQVMTERERNKFNQFLGSDDFGGEFEEAVNWLDENMPSAYKKYVNSIKKDVPPSITEFKPVGNSFDSDRALKYAERDPEYKKKINNAVLDFLNSQQWGNVSDIERYGIIDIQNPDHVIRQIDGMFGSKNRQAGIDAFNAAIDADPMSPRFMRRGDFVQFLEPYSPVDGMAKGGLVQKYDDGGLVKKFLAAAAPEAPVAWLLEKLGQGAGNIKQAITEPRVFHERALGNLARQIQEDPTEFAMNWTGGGLGGVIKPKGGNWLAGQVERAVAPMKIEKPGHVPIDTERLTAELGGDLWNFDLVDAYNADPVKYRAAVQRLWEQNNPQPAAINKWLDQKLTKYIKNEMATPEDPLRLQADRWATEQQPKLLAEKQAQLDKAKADFEKALRTRGQPPEELTRSRARILELEKERDFIVGRTGLHLDLGQREFGAPQYRALQGYRTAFGYPAEATAASTQGKKWEDLADFYMQKNPAGDIIQQNYFLRDADAKRIYNENPWLFKVPPETDVYSLNRGISERETGFKHMVDELRNALNPESGLPKELQISAKDLEKKSVADIADLVDRINAHRAVQKAEADKLAAQKSIEVYKEYPESEKGLRWVEMKLLDSGKLPEGYTITETKVPGTLAVRDAEGKQVALGKSEDDAVRNFFKRNPELMRKDLEEALKYEGDVMQHCVGGYCPDVVSGKSRIFSLRDSSGRPHATIEVVPVQRYNLSLDIKPYMAEAEELAKQLPNGYFQEDVYSIARDLAAKNAPMRIEQIKGYKNEKPAEDVIPFVQDFVKSQKWSSVGDLQNTGLVKFENKYVSPSDLEYKTDEGWRNLQEFAQERFGSRNPNQMQNFMQGAVSDPAGGYVRLANPEPKSHGGAVGMALGGLVAKYAEGGAVRFDADEIAKLAEEMASPTSADEKHVASSTKPVRVEELQLREGALSARPVRGARGDYIGRLAADVAPGAQVFADVDPWRRMLAQYGVQYVHPLPGGAASAELVVDPVNQARVLSGAYRQQLGKDSELSARGAYIQGQSERPNYNVQLQYRKRFAKGGEIIKSVDKLSKLLKEFKAKGDITSVRRAEKIADEAPKAATRINEETLRSALTGGDNSHTLALISPSSFKYLAAPLDEQYLLSGMTSKGSYYGLPTTPVSEYIDYLVGVGRDKGFDDIPFLNYKQHEGSERLGVSGHEGRHRMRAIEQLGDDKALVRLIPRANVREELPRRSREDFLRAMAEKYGSPIRLDPEDYESTVIDLSKSIDHFATGGAVKYNPTEIDALASQLQEELNG